MTSEQYAGLSSIWDAIAVVQREAPVIRKTEKVDTRAGGGTMHYNFAGLNTVWSAIGELMDQVGLVWSCRPDMEVLDGGQSRFVLRYTLWHLPTGQSLTGNYPLRGERPQDFGAGITYARRYAAVAVLNLRVAEDDDDAQAFEERSQLSPSDQVKGARQPRQTAQRRPARARQAPPATTEGQDAPETPAEPSNPNALASNRTRNKVFALVKDDLGYQDRDEYLEYVNRVLARNNSGPVSSTNDMTQQQAGWVIEAAEAALAGPPAGKPDQPADGEG